MKTARSCHIHTWCYAHVLGLVISGVSSVCVAAVSLFGLLTELSTFFNDSYKRIKVWEEHMQTKPGNKKRLRLERIGQTRWSSRGRALRKLFVSCTDQSSEFYSDLLIILQQVIEARDFKGSDRYEAQKMSENLDKFETILMAFTFIRIFDITTSVSDYLQTSGVDIMQAWRMNNKATESVEKISRDFSGTLETAFNFVFHANLKVEEVNISVPKSFSIIRSSRSAPESTVSQTRREIEVSYHNPVTDVVSSCMRARFSSHEKLYKQISCFDPDRFFEIFAFPQNVELSLMVNAVPEIDRASLEVRMNFFDLHRATKT